LVAPFLANEARENMNRLLFLFKILGGIFAIGMVAIIINSGGTDKAGSRPAGAVPTEDPVKFNTTGKNEKVFRDSKHLLLVVGDPSRNLLGFKIRDVTGKEISFTSEKDGPALTVVSFFATCCCVHCKQELRELKALKESQPSLGLVLISLDTAMDEDVNDFVREAKLDAPVIHDDKGELYDKFGMEQLPQTYLVNRQGRILLEGRRFGEGAKIPSWQSREMASLLRKAERGIFLGLPQAVRD